MDESSHDRKRAKLESSDLKLILYLIVQHKPFKYLGDRSMSQMAKWEFIQAKYKELNPDSKSATPTVRTLQRKLIRAVERVEKRKSSESASETSSESALLAAAPSNTYIDPAIASLDFSGFTPDTSKEELDEAIYELYRASERLKLRGNSEEKILNGITEKHVLKSSYPFDPTSNSNSITSSTAEEAYNKATGTILEENSILTKVRPTISSDLTIARSALKDQLDFDDKAARIEALEKLIRENQRFQENNTEILFGLLKQAESINKSIQENILLQKKETEENNILISRALSTLK